MGGVEQFGLFTTVAVGDLTNNKLPNLVISNSDDHLAYALNKGKLGAPEFDAPVPIPGVNPFPKIFSPPLSWTVTKAFSMPYVLLVCTKVKDDPTFVPPEPGIKSALKIYTVPHKHVYFPNEVYPEEDTHVVTFAPALIPIQAGVNYKTSFWVKTEGNVEPISAMFFMALENLHPVILPSDLFSRNIRWAKQVPPGLTSPARPFSKRPTRKKRTRHP